MPLLEYEVIEDFPGYGATPDGEILNLNRGMAPLTRHHNQYGHPYVSLQDPVMGQRIRQVGKLVLTAYKPKPYSHFDTVIHLDYDRDNCSIDNLEWRPRWFAVKYHRQARDSQFLASTVRIHCMENGRTYRNIRQVATVHGVLEEEVYRKLGTPQTVFPSGLSFTYA